MEIEKTADVPVVNVPGSEAPKMYSQDEYKAMEKQYNDINSKLTAYEQSQAEAKKQEAIDKENFKELYEEANTKLESSKVFEEYYNQRHEEVLNKFGEDKEDFKNLNLKQLEKLISKMDNGKQTLPEQGVGDLPNKKVTSISNDIDSDFKRGDSKSAFNKIMQYGFSSKA